MLVKPLTLYLVINTDKLFSNNAELSILKNCIIRVTIDNKLNGCNNINNLSKKLASACYGLKFLKPILNQKADHGIPQIVTL